MQRHVLLLALCCATVSAAEVTPAHWPNSRLIVDHASIALMPEGTPPDYEAFRPLRPTVIAWGEDALPTLDGGEKATAALKARFASYRQLGATSIATNVWMLTATERFLRAHPDLADTSCLDLWGERIVPAWLADADDHGVKPWWGCTNQPRYQAHLIARLRAGLSASATMVHLDDHSGTFACAAGAGGCFCARCRDGFRDWLAVHASRAELAEAGVTSLQGFDYAAFLRARRYANRDAFIHETWGGRVPLWNLFLAFERDAARSFIARLRTEAESVLGHPVAVGVNAYNLQPQQLFDADLVDYFANEVQQFDVEDTVPPLAYRLGEALGRPVFATGTGEDWIAYRRGNSVNRVRGWIAESYAFGQYFMYSWSKWGFSKETGTLWTRVPTSVYQPMCDFVHEHPALFDRMENDASVGLLYDNHSVQKDAAPTRAFAKALLDAGIPFRLVVNGDENLRRTLTAADFDGLTSVLVPANTVLRPAIADVVAAFERRGGRVVHAAAELTSDRSVSRVIVSSGARVWALPRCRETGDQRAAPSCVIHLLNRDYDASRDAFTRRESLDVTIPATFARPSSRAVFHAPGRPAIPLTMKSAANGDRIVSIPSLDIWGVIAFE